MSWKDYFSFDKRDRQAIIMILLLIVLGSIFYSLKYKKDNAIPLEQETIYQNQIDSLKKQNASYTYPPSYPTKLREGETIDINLADTTLLKQIPGIGSAYSKRIVNYRNSLGGYVSIEQIREVWGIKEELFIKIKPYLTISENHQQIKINRLTLDQLRKHPYISYKQAKAIINIRKQETRISSIDCLLQEKEFTEKDLRRLKPYLSFE